MRRKVVAANWKMHGDLAVVRHRLTHLLDADVGQSEAMDLVLFPAFVFLSELQEKLRGTQYALGAQNLSEHDEGPYTGEISSEMLRDFGCHWVLIGHSERRQYFHESDQVLLKKINQAIRLDFNIIYCVGETQQAHKAGLSRSALASQVHAILSKIPRIESLRSLVIAYEPVWAIGTGVAAAPDHASQAHAFIRKTVAQYDINLANTMPIIYGGSVSPENAGHLFAMSEIDGFLVGNASLDPKKFLEIIQCIR